MTRPWDTVLNAIRKDIIIEFGRVSFKYCIIMKINVFGVSVHVVGL